MSLFHPHHPEYPELSDHLALGALCPGQLYLTLEYVLDVWVSVLAIQSSGYFSSSEQMMMAEYQR